MAKNMIPKKISAKIKHGILPNNMVSVRWNLTLYVNVYDIYIYIYMIQYGQCIFQEKRSLGVNGNDVDMMRETEREVR